MKIIMSFVLGIPILLDVDCIAYDWTLDQMWAYVCIWCTYEFFEYIHTSLEYVIYAFYAIKIISSER